MVAKMFAININVVRGQTVDAPNNAGVPHPLAIWYCTLHFGYMY